MRSPAVRWVAVAIFALASTWNYLDRLVLSAAQPRILAEFHLTNYQFSFLPAAFALAYAFGSPVAGWLLDRIGVEVGILCAVTLWSIAACLCGFSRTFGELMGARILLGLGEAAGIPAAQKLNAMYLEPKNRALGSAMTQVGLSIGGVAAPILVASMEGWRQPFFVCAALGMAWLPLWTLVRRRVAPAFVVPKAPADRSVLRDRRLHLLAAANVLWMGIYVLWSTWTTQYLHLTFGLSVVEIAKYAWLPPVSSTLGAFAGGWISRHRMNKGAAAVDARIFGALISAIGCLVVIAAPFCPTPFLAVLVISASYFWATAGSANLYTIAVDIWGIASAGTAVSALVFAYGLLQAGISPVFGKIVDLFGFAPVCWLVALPPLAGWWLLTRIQVKQV